MCVCSSRCVGAVAQGLGSFSGESRAVGEKNRRHDDLWHGPVIDGQLIAEHHEMFVAGEEQIAVFDGAAVKVVDPCNHCRIGRRELAGVVADAPCRSRLITSGRPCFSYVGVRRLFQRFENSPFSEGNWAACLFDFRYCIC